MEKVFIWYDDEPDDVAKNFMKALNKLGLICTEKMPEEGEDSPIEYTISLPKNVSFPN